MRKHAVSIQRFASVSPCVETNRIKVQEAPGPCKRVTHRGGKSSSAAPLTASSTDIPGSIAWFSRRPIPAPPAAAKPPHYVAKPKSQREGLPLVCHTAEHVDKPGFASAAEDPTIRTKALTPAITPLPCRLLGAGQKTNSIFLQLTGLAPNWFECNNNRQSPSKSLLLPHPFYHPPFRFAVSGNDYTGH